MTAERPKYRVLHELGAGGMGLIWKGLLVGQAGFQRPLVIKQLKHAGDPGHLQLFVEEARRYALLDHENIGRIFDFDEVAGELCIILEYIDGWTLIEYLDRHEEHNRRPDVDLSVFIASRVCRALQYVFERAKIVHRDISPSNIMMTREGTVKLIDFGIATRSGTRDHALTGKPAYMAPEMVTEMRTDNRSDLFSLGAVLYELLTGQRLFRAKTTAEVLEKVVAGAHPLRAEPAARRPGSGGGHRAPRPGAQPRPPLRLGGRDGRGLRAPPLRQGLRAHQPDLEALRGAALPRGGGARISEAAFPLVDATLLPALRRAADAAANGREATATRTRRPSRPRPPPIRGWSPSVPIPRASPRARRAPPAPCPWPRRRWPSRPRRRRHRLPALPAPAVTDRRSPASADGRGTGARRRTTSSRPAPRRPKAAARAHAARAEAQPR